MRMRVQPYCLFLRIIYPVYVCYSSISSSSMTFLSISSPYYFTHPIKGSICERMALSCRQLQESGYQPDFYSVQLNLRNETPARPITVYCTLSPDNSVLTYLFRSTGKEEHNHTWEEYSKGYVINDGNLWLGLDNMATLSASSDYGMVGVSVILRSARQDRTFSLIYTNFSIGDFQTQYRYTVTTPPVSVSSGDLGPSYTLTDIFGPSQNTPFSTSDEDNDADMKHNCAALAGAGWWFKLCETWTSTGYDRINPLGWTPEKRPNTSTDFRNLLALPGLNLEDPALKETFLVINAYYYQASP